MPQNKVCKLLEQKDARIATLEKVLADLDAKHKKALKDLKAMKKIIHNWVDDD